MQRASRALFLERVEELREVHMRPHVDQVPIVQSRSPHGVIIDAKTETSDEMKHRRCRRTQTRDVSRVRWDFRLDEHDVKRQRARVGETLGA